MPAMPSSSVAAASRRACWSAERSKSTAAQSTVVPDTGVTSRGGCAMLRRMDLRATAEQEALRASFRAWLIEHLPWPYGVGLPPRFDDLAETVAFGRRWQAELAADGWVGVTWPDRVRRPRPRGARELRGHRGAGPGPGARAGRPHRHQPRRARPCWPTARPSRRSASCRGSSRPPSCGASSSASRTPGATWRRSPPGPCRSTAATGSAGARCGPPTPSSPTGACA